MQIEVSDLYDTFFDIARILWMRGEFKDRPDGSSGTLGPRYDFMLDELEVDVFFSACSRRLARLMKNYYIPPLKIRRLLTLHDHAGMKLNGEEGKYQSQAFDWGMPTDDDIKNCVAAGNLAPRLRTDTRIFLTIDEDVP